jgi:hypothetical protein
VASEVPSTPRSTIETAAREIPTRAAGAPDFSDTPPHVRIGAPDGWWARSRRSAAGSTDPQSKPRIGYLGAAVIVYSGVACDQLARTECVIEGLVDIISGLPDGDACMS